VDEQENKVTDNKVVPTHEFGDVSPCLAVARLHNVDWSVPLVITDYLLHGRDGYWYDQVLSMPHEKLQAVLADCLRVARRTQAQFAIADRSDLRFFPGAGWRSLGADGVWS
jgi:hypothetical protein